MQEARKVALITGANKGIGFEVARQLERAGYTLVIEHEIQSLAAQH